MASAIFEAAAAQWQAMRSDFDQVLTAHMQAAVAATNGVLLSRQGQAAGIDPHELFRRSPASVRGLASEELLDFWERTPRPTLQAFEADWVDALYDPAMAA